jgi:zinc-dependent metalloproteinase lipoprotein
LVTAIICLLSACKSNDVAIPSIALSTTSVSTNSVASTTTITATGNYDWKLSSDQSWCTTSVSTGTAGKETSIKITLEANSTTSERTAHLNFTIDNETVATANCTQSAEETYELPVIFHVLYNEQNDSLQYVQQSRIAEIISGVNQLYSNNNMNLKFVLATTNPEGSTLSEQGIDRQKISSSSLDCDNFMDGKLADSNKYINMLWDLNSYINVFLFPFATDNSGYTTLGITYLPMVSSSKTLSGLAVGNYYLTHSWDYPQCSAINSLYVYETSTSTAYNTADATITIAHELGHYLGLFHVFSSNGCSDTDYCDDTPNYDRANYEEWLSAYLEAHPDDYSLSEVTSRTSCSGSTFTAHNIMDYEFCYNDEFTTNQRERTRFVLNYALFVPGTKYLTTTSRAESSNTRPEGITKATIVNTKILKLTAKK